MAKLTKNGGAMRDNGRALVDYFDNFGNGFKVDHEGEMWLLRHNQTDCEINLTELALAIATRPSDSGGET